MRCLQETSEQQAAASAEAGVHPIGNESTAKWRLYTNLARDLSREVRREDTPLLALHAGGILLGEGVKGQSVPREPIIFGASNMYIK